MQKYPSHLQQLIGQLKRLPGVGSKSAERFAFQMIDWPPSALTAFADTVKNIPEKLHICKECGSLSDEAGCMLCKTPPASRALCVVAYPKDVYALEGTGEFTGHYHVLGGLLSPLEGIGPEKLSIGKLKQRLQSLEIEEVILALDSTLEGDATSLFLKQELEPLDLSISRLAFGMPIGSSFDYVDGGTLARALSARGKY